MLAAPSAHNDSYEGYNVSPLYSPGACVLLNISATRYAELPITPAGMIYETSYCGNPI